jgi:hypothetical protein
VFPDVSGHRIGPTSRVKRPTRTRGNGLPTLRGQRIGPLRCPRNVGKQLPRVRVGLLTREVGPIRCPETSVNNYHKTPCNNPEDYRFLFL